VEYDYPGGNGMVHKTAWVVDVGDGAFMGCGVTRQGPARTAAPAPVATPAAQEVAEPA
jgi:hypothetical protein